MEYGFVVYKDEEDDRVFLTSGQFGHGTVGDWLVNYGNYTFKFYMDHDFQRKFRKTDTETGE